MLLGLAWSHYAQMRAEEIDDQIAPTASFLFQMLIAQNHRWVQFIPTAVACAWAIRRYLNNRARWNWQNDYATPAAGFGHDVAQCMVHR
jgi:hypothetical protein